MTEQQTKIDPETFAYHFMETIHRPEIDKEDMEAAAKRSFSCLSDWLLFDPKIQSFGK
jgi:hypothetical protein